MAAVDADGKANGGVIAWPALARDDHHRHVTPRRYHGTVTLDATRMGADAGKIAEEVVAHLVGLMDSQVTVTLQTSAEVPSGVPEQVALIVTENGHTLRFDSQGFEVE